MDKQTTEEGIRCQRCGSPLRISKGPRNRGKIIDCLKCYRANYYAANRADGIAKSKLYYQQTRDRRLKCAKDWRSKNLDKHRANARKAKLKTRCSTPEYYDAKLTEQSGRCALCGSPPHGKRKLGQDHCHKNLKPRGLLCDPCNRRVGWFEAIRSVIPKIENYLAQYEKEN